ncbi:Odorant receptor 131-2 [Merluccius polli]|uniref:Odorant receptor 131-2 n=1 Tax=Merluccius polli TaxID=89951 RepID=A0AA47NM35_MERPO|nr:Odorant receptor 131-2 [Merluccius polli]
MLYTLRSKTVFSETSRYLLLYSLLLAENLQMALAQLMFLLASGSVFMTRLVCLLMLTLTIITTIISPFNLALMSLERYVAVCFPLRYANIVNATSTYGAIAVVWAVSFANMLVRVLMLMVLDPRPLGQFIGMTCSKEAIFQLKIFSEFESGFVCAEFVSVGIIIICSYVGVIIAAKSASTDKASANKARKTVLLHMIQLCLSLCSTLVTTILTGLSGKVDRLTFIDIRFALFVCLINLPRCLSCLIYGSNTGNAQYRGKVSAVRLTSSPSRPRRRPVFHPTLLPFLSEKIPRRHPGSGATLSRAWTELSASSTICGNSGWQWRLKVQTRGMLNIGGRCPPCGSRPLRLVLVVVLSSIRLSSPSCRSVVAFYYLGASDPGVPHCAD